VDTVVTRCRGRETDEKCVTAEIYDARNARQRDGDAKRTAGQSSLSLFFVFVVRCVLHRKLQRTFPIFFELKQSGQLALGPACSLGERQLLRYCAGERSSRRGAMHARDHRGHLGYSARGFGKIFFFTRSDRELEA
jgi:hypothetical protein